MLMFRGLALKVTYPLVCLIVDSAITSDPHRLVTIPTTMINRSLDCQIILLGVLASESGEDVSQNLF